MLTAIELLPGRRIDYYSNPLRGKMENETVIGCFDHVIEKIELHIKEAEQIGGVTPSGWKICNSNGSALIYSKTGFQDRCDGMEISSQAMRKITKLLGVECEYE